MGCDGPGIFDNDTCGDFLSEICEQSLDVIRHDLSFERMCLERKEPAAIAILVGITKHIPISRCFIESTEIADFCQTTCPSESSSAYHVTPLMTAR